MTARTTITAAEFRALPTGGQKNAAGRNAKPCTVQGIRFASQHEARVWGDLRYREMAGQITDLRRQVPVILMGAQGPILTPTGKPMRYVADFAFWEDGVEVWADAKGHAAEVYQMKRAILAAQGIHVREV